MEGRGIRLPARPSSAPRRRPRHTSSPCPCVRGTSGSRSADGSRIFVRSPSSRTPRRGCVSAWNGPLGHTPCALCLCTRLSPFVTCFPCLHFTMVSSIWQTGLPKTLSAFVKSVRYYGKLRKRIDTVFDALDRGNLLPSGILPAASRPTPPATRRRLPSCWQWCPDRCRRSARGMAPSASGIVRRGSRRQTFSRVS